MPRHFLHSPPKINFYLYFQVGLAHTVILFYTLGVAFILHPTVKLLTELTRNYYTELVNHYRNLALCRVPGSLLCEFYRAHSKESFCHVSTQ